MENPQPTEYKKFKITYWITFAIAILSTLSLFVMGELAIALFLFLPITILYLLSTLSTKKIYDLINENAKNANFFLYINLILIILIFLILPQNIWIFIGVLFGILKGTLLSNSVSVKGISGILLMIIGSVMYLIPLIILNALLIKSKKNNTPYYKKAKILTIIINLIAGIQIVRILFDLIELPA